MLATLTPKYIDAPKEGKKNWAVKDEAGNRWSVPPHVVQQMRTGVPVQVTYRENEWQGKTINMVEAVVAGNPAVQSGNGQVLKPDGTFQSLATTIPPNMALHPVGKPLPDAKAREMFIMGVVGRAMGSGSFTATDINILTLAAADAWDELGRRVSTEDAPY